MKGEWGVGGVVGNGEKGGIGKKVERGKETRLGEKGHKEKGEEEEKRGSTHVYITIVQQCNS